jgi:hypothetical protein
VAPFPKVIDARIYTIITEYDPVFDLEFGVWRMDYNGFFPNA